MDTNYNQSDVIVSHSMNEQRHPRKRWLLAIAVVVVAIAAIAGFLLWNKKDGSKTAAISTTVANATIEQTGYVPSTVTVKKGQEVTWTNKDTSPHRLTADQSMLPGFDTSDSLDAGDSYTYIFDTPGTFHYYDPADPKAFVGTVIVEQ